jgi:hypothetical protein
MFNPSLADADASWSSQTNTSLEEQQVSETAKLSSHVSPGLTNPETRKDENKPDASGSHL